MSLYVLDSNMVQLLQEENPTVVARVRAVALADRAISVITVEEQLSGWYTQLRQAKQPERLAWAYRRLAANVRFLIPTPNCRFRRVGDSALRATEETQA